MYYRLILVALVLAGCGKPPILVGTNREPVQAVVEEVFNEDADEFEEATPSTASAPRRRRVCKIRFASADLCASLTWHSRPSFGSKPAIFTLRTWKPSHGSLSDPAYEVSALVRMSCCKTPVQGVRQRRQGRGEIVFDEIRFFSAGDFEVLVSLTDGSGNVVDQYQTRPFSVAKSL